MRDLFRPKFYAPKRLIYNGLQEGQESGRLSSSAARRACSKSCTECKRVIFVLCMGYCGLVEKFKASLRASHRETFSALRRRITHNLGLGGGNSRADTWSAKPLVLCEPSQKGLLAEWPHRQKATTVRPGNERSEEHTSELQSPCNLVCRLLLEKKKK